MSLQTIHWYNIDIRIAKGSDGMKKVNYVLLILLVSILFSAKNTFAYDINNYRYRSLCGNYEVSRFNEDGSIVALSCHNTYEQVREQIFFSKHAYQYRLIGSAYARRKKTR